MVTLLPERSTFAPNARRATSPWSRVRDGSSTAVTPSASNPANSSDVLTCALATGDRYSMPRRVAPVRLSGSMMRFIGRRDSDSSPIISMVKGWPATMPASMRMVDPELPQLSGPAGSHSRGPSPSMVTVPRASCSTVQPRPRTQPRVLAQSAPGAKFSKRERPLASAASIAYRCEIDLSPGTRKLPRMLRAGRTRTEWDIGFLAVGSSVVPELPLELPAGPGVRPREYAAQTQISLPSVRVPNGPLPNAREQTSPQSLRTGPPAGDTRRHRTSAEVWLRVLRPRSPRRAR